FFFFFFSSRRRHTRFDCDWSSDVCSSDLVFVEQLKNLASPGDLLLAISGSGNSPNILKAVDWANRHGLTTVGFSGFSGGKLKAKIGRASCRERVESRVEGGCMKRRA